MIRYPRSNDVEVGTRLSVLVHCRFGARRPGTFTLTRASVRAHPFVRGDGLRDYVATNITQRSSITDKTMRFIGDFDRSHTKLTGLWQAPCLALVALDHWSRWMMHTSSMGEYARRCREPQGPFHDFWLFREGTRAHADYDDLLGRKDAPVRMSDDVLQHLLGRLSSMPTENPACRCEPGVGLNVYGPTVIAASGGRMLHDALSAWIDRFPESLTTVDLEYAATSHGVDAVEGEIISRRQSGLPADPWTAGANLSADLADCATDGGEVFIEVIQVPRVGLAEQIRTLAEFGRLAAEGTHFVLHLGI